jgi:NAD(P)-dependent dehydrogenase (short-subunit alcohol dehydrogenase family)
MAHLASAGLPVSLERLFLGRIGDTAPTHSDSAAMWLVNGAYSRPAREPKRVPRAVAVQTIATPTAPVASAVAPIGTQVPQGPRAGAAQVMLSYQRLMEHFLAAQKQVMLTYLENGGAQAPVGSAAVASRMSSLAEMPARAIVPVPPAIVPPPQAARVEAAPIPAAAPTAPDNRQSIADALIGMISERTGYPAEMLGLDLNIEADLGIDSIKRVEILGAFRKQHIGELTDSVRVVMEQLVRKKTLREVVDGCAALLAAPSAERALPTNESASPNGRARAIEPEMTPRFAMVPVRTAAVSRALRPNANDVFLLTDDGTGVAQALAGRLRAQKARAVILGFGAETHHMVGDDHFIINLADLGAVQELWQRRLSNGHHLGGVFHCLPLRTSKPFWALDMKEWRAAIRCNVKSLFNLAVMFDKVISNQDEPCVVAATRQGGMMGLEDAEGPVVDPTQGGVPGLLKTLDKEWPRVRCKSVDFAADASPEEIAERLLIEAAEAKGEVEIGYRGSQRLLPRVEWRPISTPKRPVMDISERFVILVTGGARGITSEIVRELADRYHPTLVLCGSSSEPPAAEDPSTARCADARSLKAALIKAATARGETAAPAAIETAYRGLLKEREIRDTLKAARRTARAVEYHQVDVRDEAAFGALIDAIYARYGRLDGVIHGAGVVEDKLIGDKTADSFDRVVETKLLSSFTLTRKLKAESLSFFALFASVAGTFGNRGQSDYGAANEILARLAVHLNRTWPGRVVAFSWGPWDKTGMVTPEIKQQFEAQGIEPVSPELGRWALAAELCFGGKTDVCPIWGNGPWAAKRPEGAAAVDAGQGTRGSPAPRGQRHVLKPDAKL